MLPNHNTGLPLFTHRTQINTTSPKNFLKVLPHTADVVCNKTDEIQIFIENVQADFITKQDQNSINPTKHQTFI